MSEAKPSWTCPKCNTINDNEFTHCRMCAERNPALGEIEKTCAKCGFHTAEECCPVCNSSSFLQL